MHALFFHDAQTSANNQTKKKCSKYVTNTTNYIIFDWCLSIRDAYLVCKSIFYHQEESRVTQGKSVHQKSNKLATTSTTCNKNKSTRTSNSVCSPPAIKEKGSHRNIIRCSINKSALMLLIWMRAAPRMIYSSQHAITATGHQLIFLLALQLPNLFDGRAKE